jgi:hypothetical protein
MELESKLRIYLFRFRVSKLISYFMLEEIIQTEKDM